MRVTFHPKFATDIQGHRVQYDRIGPSLGQRFRMEVDFGIEAVKTSPMSAGHYLDTGSEVVREVRRRNVRSFPFFILYGLHEDELIFASLIPSRSDPLKWLRRFPRSK